MLLYVYQFSGNILSLHVFMTLRNSPCDNIEIWVAYSFKKISPLPFSYLVVKSRSFRKLLWWRFWSWVVGEGWEPSFQPQEVTVLLCVRDRIPLCSPSCPETHSIDQAGLQLRDPSASASRVLRLKVCATTSQRKLLILKSPGKKVNLQCLI